MAKDGQLFNWRSMLKSLDFQFGKPGFMRLLVKHYLPYYLHSFHPWDHDNRAQMRAWKQTFEATGYPAKAYRAFIGTEPPATQRAAA